MKYLIFIQQKLKQYFNEYHTAKTYFGAKIALLGFVYHLSGAFGTSYYTLLYPAVLKAFPELGHVNCEDFYNSFKDQKTKNNGPIWTLWWQLDSQPSLVQACINSIKKNANGRNVIVLNADNISNYLTIPSHIQKLVETGGIDYTQLSNYIRCSLLSKYGGVWIDSTCFLHEQLPNSIRKLPFSTIARKQRNPIRNWTTYFLASVPHNPLFITMSKFYEHYFKTIVKPYDYFYFDIALSVIYQNNGKIKDMVDQGAIIQANPFFMFDHMNDPESKIKELDFGPISKLTYKKDYKSETLGGKPTVFTWIIKQQ